MWQILLYEFDSHCPSKNSYQAETPWVQWMWELLQKVRPHKTSENTREKPHKYNECGKAFCMKSTLIIYQWTHSVDKSFKCSECKKSFYVKLLLNSHQRYHTGKKSHVCKVCGKAFSMKSSLTGLSWGRKNNPCCKCRLQTLWETFTNRINWAVLKTWSMVLSVQKSKA